MQDFKVFFVVLVLFLSACGTDIPEGVQLAKEQLPATIDFNLHVKPILSDKCYFCHGPDLANRKSGLRLDTPDGAFSASESGKKAIVPGKIGKSELVRRILASDEEVKMPPAESNVPISDYERAILIKWIEGGAEYKKHWALIEPQKTALPEVKNQDLVVNGIDNFIFKTLEDNQLDPQQEADKETLIRRVTFDLTGLPPTVSEIDDFLKDNSENAYEKVVDRLLASAHYGEKMAADWMDVARYADTHGYSVDRYRAMWPWRDWVIRAFNSNQPYDEFVTWQLAGDLLPNPTREQLIATGFNRNHAQNMEGGIVNEEFRIEYVADRTNTFGKAFLAMTFECSRCHDHKFDPISQKEYFQVFSFFNHIDEAGQISWDDAMPVPTMLLTDKKQDSIIRFLDEQIATQEQQIANQGYVQPVSLHRAEINVKAYLDRQLTGHFNFDKAVDNRFPNLVNPQQMASVVEPQPNKTKALDPVLTTGKEGKGLTLNGDDPLTLGTVGTFGRSQPFSVSLWINLPADLTDGVIFHKGQGAILYNFRGYHLALRDNKFELMMAHTWPYNNIIKVSATDVPKDRWVHLTMTYDGSSRAEGLRLYQDGQPVAVTTEKDNLYKGILFPHLKNEPGLRFGARWRGIGVKGAVVDEIRVYKRELHTIEIGLLAGNYAVLNEKQQATLVDNRAIWNKLDQLQALRAKRNAMVESIPEIMILDELAEKRKTHILERGAYDAPGEEVDAGAPVSILPFSDDLPKNRLGLAQWLFSAKNPLTARVIVNRYWQSYFGTGLVKSAADFGNQGSLPSHLELLDWLAIHFRESGWDIKGLQKKIVMSAAYRQSSEASDELLEKDYDNKLISRGPSSRLTAEMLRDNALFASGLLVNKIGGESVKPYQPDGLWVIGGSRYRQDKGEKLYRRSLYTIWKRTVPPPSMNTFDAPTRSYCVVTRQKTSTPLQSLVLLNDPQFVEACRALAAKVSIETTGHEERISNIYRSLTSKRPSAKEIDVLKSFYQKQLGDFKTQPEKMDGWLKTGEFKPKDPVNKEELATYTVLASMVMNSDAATSKR
ncbi:DUF1553 domain-containing protein [Fulvivirgaceae bacterium BMA12]|uniref:DUF1553 domain-containing protein n=1 Tax=Agaribacillus aureus TaxID=3051825 RepID=A0ABT8L228_9BACT|nr:DUF1553 domain-containing protein [Fulvivirgaceae bacterium BMA12]